MAIRMGEERLGLGLAITKGSIIGYSTERMTTIKNKMEEIEIESDSLYDEHISTADVKMINLITDGRLAYGIK